MAQDGVLRVGHHAEGAVLHAEGLQEPQQHAHGQDQGARLDQEALHLLPHVEADVLQGGQPVGGQLQHEGGGLTLEHQLLEQDAGDDGKNQAQEVEGKHHQSAVPGEEGGGEQAVHRQPGGAGHEGHQHDGHAAVLLVLHGAGAHDGGHGAAEAHEHGDEGLTREAEPAEQPVHDEGRPGHIAGVLQEGQEDKQDGDLGQEGKYAAYTGDDAVHQQGLHPGSGAGHGQDPADPLGKAAADEEVHPVGQDLSGPEGECEHGQHHQQEDGDGQELVGDDGVDLVGEGQGIVGLSLHHRRAHHLLDELIPAVGDEGLPVAQDIGALIVPADGLQLFLGPAVQAQGLLHQGISLDELDGGPVSGQAHLVGLVVDELTNLVVDAVGVVVVEGVGLHRHTDVHLPVGHP